MGGEVSGERGWSVGGNCVSLKYCTVKLAVMFRHKYKGEQVIYCAQKQPALYLCLLMYVSA